jgi:hydrogenase nickel incorporation protein HypB
VGEDYKVVMLSVTEGDEKPLKYPLIFRESALLLINKIDLLKYTNFNLKEAKANARRVNPDLDIIDISCTTGEGIADWISWLNQRYQKKFGTKARA